MSDRRKIFLPLLVLAVGAALALAVVKARPTVEREIVEAVPPLVRIVETETQTLRFTVHSQGSVQARTETTISAQVPGQIRSVSPRFAQGEHFARGEVLLTIDPRDAQAVVSQAEAQVAQNEVALEREQAEAALAVEEWQELGSGQPSSLTLRQPQMAQARAALAASGAVLERARLDLERTAIRAPFSGRLRRKLADVGQYVAPGTPLAEMYSTDVAEIKLPVPKSELAFLDLALSGGERQTRLQVELSAEIGGRERRWAAEIVRTGGEIDARTRMFDLFARVEKPLEQAAGPLTIGLFVAATITGAEANNVIVLPRTALRGAARVLVVDADDRMYFRSIGVLRTEAETVIVSSGLEVGERVCVSPIETIVDGMRVRPVLDDRSNSAEDTAAGAAS